MSTQQGVVKGERLRAVDSVTVETGNLAGTQAAGLLGAADDATEGTHGNQAQGLLEQSRSRSHALLSAAQQEALDIVSQARTQAQEITENAQREAAAREAGLEKELRARLEQEYSERFSAAVRALEGAGKELRRREDEYVERIEQPALSLVLAIARQLIRAEWEQDRSALARMVGAALRQLQPEDCAVLSLAPETLARVGEGAALDSAFAENGVRLGQIRLEADPTLSTGQFSLRAGNVSVGFDLDSALAEMASHLRLASSGQLGGAPGAFGADDEAALAADGPAAREAL